ncbi:MAG: cobalamin biosynthesis protein CbiX, partial [Burkholderiales bacterium]|nr:cobalamin biosynthesis protein CbiX [Burkholderiales bacterium]
DIAAAAAALAADGCAQVEVVPLFLGTGGHVRRDLPALLDTLRQHHAGVAFTLHPPVGEIASVIDAMAAAAARSLDPR